MCGEITLNSTISRPPSTGVIIYDRRGLYLLRHFKVEISGYYVIHGNEHSSSPERHCLLACGRCDIAIFRNGDPVGSEVMWGYYMTKEVAYVFLGLLTTKSTKDLPQGGLIQSLDVLYCPHGQGPREDDNNVIGRAFLPLAC